MNCTRCSGTGFLNHDQLPEGVLEQGTEVVFQWIAVNNNHDVTVCDCCGDGEEGWHGEPGQHYGDQDPPGKNGPYAHNGGHCECH